MTVSHKLSQCVNAFGVVALLLLSAKVVGAGENTPSLKQVLGVENAVHAALANDPWLIGNQHKQDAVIAMSVAAGTLPDPTVSIGVANIAADTFDFNQEAMTQFKVGVSQALPRGDSLALRKRQLELTSQQYPYQRQDRQAQVAVTVAILWLDAYKAQESIALIEKDRALFEQLADVARASYSTAMGKTRQQDMVRAELELTRLEDRLAVLKQQQEVSLRRLSEWFNHGSHDRFSRFMDPSNITLVRTLPDIAQLQPQLSGAATEIRPQNLFNALVRHPAINALEQQIKATESGIELAKQKYKPAWGINVGYGFRDDDALGNNRADLFSVGVSFDLPIFTANRQDKQVASAVSTASAVKTQKALLIRKMMATFESHRVNLRRLNQRQRLYKQQLLPQMHDQAQASLTAYTNDDGDFAEVVRARIAELNAAIDALSINVERQKSIVQLNYFFMNQAQQMIAENPPVGEYR